MKEYFKNQLGGRVPLTLERISTLSDKKTHLGNNINVGDHLYYAYLNQGEGIKSKNYKFITLIEKEFDKYNLEIEDLNTRLPLLKLKNI